MVYIGWCTKRPGSGAEEVGPSIRSLCLAGSPEGPEVEEDTATEGLLSPGEVDARRELEDEDSMRAIFSCHSAVGTTGGCPTKELVRGIELFGMLTLV